jgi:hypothetical protein
VRFAVERNVVMLDLICERVDGFENEGKVCLNEPTNTRSDLCYALSLLIMQRC